MADDTYQEKTEAPTPKRRQDAREKGIVAKSVEIPSVVILLTSLIVFSLAGSRMMNSTVDFMRWAFQNAGSFDIRESSSNALLVEVFDHAVTMMLPLLLAIIVAGIIANVLQIGFLFTGQPLVPKMSKLDPVNGLKRIFSSRGLVEFIKSLVKFLFIGAIAYLLLKKEMLNIPPLMHAGVGDILSFVGNGAFGICLYVSLSLIVVAGLDYAFQRWRHEKELRMSRQELRDELKQTEGDPLVKSRIKSIQFETARRRMMEEVPKADFVVTNPTEIAVAVRYDVGKMSAPKVTAKGAGYVAEKIRQIANENSIPVVERKPLARTLFKTVKIGDHIPVELYRAVAEILAYVYRLKGKA